MDRRSFIESVCAAFTSLFVRKTAAPALQWPVGGVSNLRDYSHGWERQVGPPNPDWRNYTSVYSSISRDEMIEKIRPLMAEMKKNMKVLGGDA